MRARCASLTMVESSVPAETWAMTPSNSEATGLDMPAWKRGFCRRIAAVSVEPARGRPDMKWNVRLVGDTNCSRRDRPSRDVPCSETACAAPSCWQILDEPLNRP